MQQVKERFEDEKGKMRLKWKAEQKQCLQNLALRMLLESDAKQSKALSLHSSKLQQRKRPDMDEQLGEGERPRIGL